MPSYEPWRPGHIRSNLTSPPPYENYAEWKPPVHRRRPWWDVRGWSRSRRVIVVVCAAIILVCIIIGAVVGSLKGGSGNGHGSGSSAGSGGGGGDSSSYPNYKPLDYTLSEKHEGENFFNGFDYFTGYDPSDGFVIYANATQSSAYNLTSASSTSAVLKVDNTQIMPLTGRVSSRIISRATYEDGLFIFDVIHTPYGCASWPAVWLTDQAAWPKKGEIDVTEAVNRATDGNQMTLHTTEDCTMEDVVRKQTGRALHGNCYNETNGNSGCGVRGPPSTFGKELNEKGGGVYAMELRSDGIRVWFFPRNDIPKDITQGTAPQPDNWGEAMADFPSTRCDIGTHFRNLNIIVNIDVCGKWAGSHFWYKDKASCPGHCHQFAAENPAAFNEAYWEFKSFKIYKANS